MYLEDIKTGKEYVFELKDRLIRDNETDGWKEVPVKVENRQNNEEINEQKILNGNEIFLMTLSISRCQLLKTY